MNIKRLALAASLGLFTTIAVAWTLATIDIPVYAVGTAQQILPARDPMIGMPFLPRRNQLHVTVWHAPGRIVIHAFAFGPEISEYVGTPGFLPEHREMPPDELAPLGLRAHATPWTFGLPWPVGRATEMSVVQASGWPLLALAAIERGVLPTTHLRYGFDIGGERTIGNLDTLGHARPRVLPLRPVWPGVIVDTAVFSAAWWAAITAPIVLLRRSRIRRGLCSACRYDLRGLHAAQHPHCPECGAAR